MDSDESKPAEAKGNMPRYVKEFEDTYFWKHVMLPSMHAAVLTCMERLVYTNDVREIRRLQVQAQTLQSWSTFPKRKHTESKDDTEFEADKHKGEKDSETA